MAKLYYRRIKAGAMSLGDVPALWRQEVQALLDADGSQEGGR